MYQAPNMGVVELNMTGNVLFEGSGSTPGFGGNVNLDE